MELRQRQPRVLDARYIAAVRLLPCAIRPCQRLPIEAAHIRFGRHGLKRATGLGERPDDRWALPLCRWHHSHQHRSGEVKWWQDRGIDPIEVAIRLYAERYDHDAMLNALMTGG